jgi:hypothetical protein
LGAGVRYSAGEVNAVAGAGGVSYAFEQHAVRREFNDLHLQRVVLGVTRVQLKRISNVDHDISRPADEQREVLRHGYRLAGSGWTLV